MAAIDDIVSNLKNAVTNLGLVATVLNNAFPRVTGSFTLAAATTTMVTQPATAANTEVFFSPTNATAALTQSGLGLFHSSNTPGTSFSISTVSGPAHGTETFEYYLVNPA